MTPDRVIGPGSFGIGATVAAGVSGIITDYDAPPIGNAQYYATPAAINKPSWLTNWAGIRDEVASPQRLIRYVRMMDNNDVHFRCWENGAWGTWQRFASEDASIQNPYASNNATGSAGNAIKVGWYGPQFSVGLQVDNTWLGYIPTAPNGRFVLYGGGNFSCVGSVNIYAQQNVYSIARVSTGRFAVTTYNNMPNINYLVIATAAESAGYTANAMTCRVSDKAVNGFTIQTGYSAGVADPGACDFIIVLLG